MTKNTDKGRLDTNSPPRPADIDAIPELVHPAKVTKITNKIIVVALIIIFLVLFRIISWALETNQPLVINNSPFPTRSVRSAADPNGVIILTVDFCKNTDAQGKIRTSFVSSTREVFLPLTEEQFNKGCAKEEIPVLIPKDLPADDYKLKFIARYNLNPLKKQVPIVFESQVFHVNPLGTDDELVQRTNNKQNL